MDFWRRHWFDVGGLLALVLGGWLWTHRVGLDTGQLLLGASLVSLLLHQVEEYRWPGYFPGMLNAVLYQSAAPDRYPLNTNTSLLVNVALGWVVYGLAFGLPRLVWLGIATQLVSLGNVVAHTFLFNLKGKTWYNPGQATALLLFLPLALGYGYLLGSRHLAMLADWLVGMLLGVALNYFGILKPIDWLADRSTPFRFATRQLRPADRRG